MTSLAASEGTGCGTARSAGRRRSPDIPVTEAEVRGNIRIGEVSRFSN